MSGARAPTTRFGTYCDPRAKRIIAHNENIEIQLDTSALRQTVLGISEEDAQTGNDPDELVVIAATARLERCDGEVPLILRPDSSGAKPVAKARP